MTAKKDAIRCLKCGREVPRGDRRCCYSDCLFPLPPESRRVYLSGRHAADCRCSECMKRGRPL